MGTNKKIISMIVISSILAVGCSNIQESKTVESASTQSKQEVNQNRENLNITSMNQILEYAQKAQDSTSDINNSLEKIEMINKLVVSDDLYDNTSENLKNEVLKYLESEYKDENIKKYLEKNYYLTEYLACGDNTHEIIMSMNNYLENTIKLNDSGNDKEDIQKLIENNKEKIDKYIYTNVKLYDSKGNMVE